MQVQVEGKYVYNVEVLQDGSWNFKFDHGDGFIRDVHTYSKEYVYTNLSAGTWEIVNVVQEQDAKATPNYAAAFNMWMDQYVNDPQTYESIYDTAMRHVSEKLGGYEPSYGEVCAEVLVNYLNKLESK